MASAKEQIWLNEYLTCWNATEAARRAGYRWPNKIGPRKREKFKGEIQRRLDESAMGANEILMRLAEQARGRHGEYLRENGTIDFAQLIIDGKQHLVRKISQGKYGLTVEFHDAQAALVHLGRHFGLFSDKLEIHDWRKEAQEKGLDPATVFERYVQDAAAALATGAGATEGGSVADGGGTSQDGDD